MIDDDSGTTSLDTISGPIDYLVLSFPGARLTGQGLAAIIDLVDRGLVQVLDLRVVKREADGSWSGVDIADLTVDGFDATVFAGVSSGLLDDDDLHAAAQLVAPGDGAGLLVYENTWARPFVRAMVDQGAELVAGGRIPAPDVIAALERLDAASR
jgi:hypothetical protein